MLKKSLLLLTLAAACATAQAQTTPAKREMVTRILKLQQPGIEAMARQITRQPAAELLAGAAEYLQTRVPADQRETLAKGLQQDADKYLNETFPVVRDRALKLAPGTIGAVLEEKFTEDELRQVVAMMESPVFVKFQALGGDMERALMGKLVPELRPQIAPRLRTLDEAFAKRLGVQPAMQAPAAPAATRPAAPAQK